MALASHFTTFLHEGFSSEKFRQSSDLFPQPLSYMSDYPLSSISYLHREPLHIPMSTESLGSPPEKKSRFLYVFCVIVYTSNWLQCSVEGISVGNAQNLPRL